MAELSINNGLASRMATTVFSGFRGLLFLRLASTGTVPSGFVCSTNSHTPGRAGLRRLGTPRMASMNIGTFHGDILATIGGSSLHAIRLPGIRAVNRQTFDSL